jgi:hypothetical protein
VGDHGVVVDGRVEVAGQVVEAGLQVEDEEEGVVAVEAFPGDD